MVNELQTMDVLKQSLVTQNEQGKALIAVIERMEEQEKRVDGKINEVENLVEAVSKQVTLSDGEAAEVQRAVNEKSVEFARRYFEEKGFGSPVDTNLFLSKLGQFRGLIYKRLKAKMNVVKYTAIKHVRYEEALDYIKIIDYNWFVPQETRWTPKQLELLDRLVITV